MRLTVETARPLLGLGIARRTGTGAGTQRTYFFASG